MIIATLTGNETDQQLEQLAWRMFCEAHPHEAFEQNPNAFWDYFHEKAPSMSRERMVALLKETD